MAIIECPNCGKEISDRATACIHCGYELIKKEKRKCPECGAELEDGALVCGKCGCPIDDHEPAAIPQKVEVTKVSLKPKSKKPIIILAAVILAILCGYFGISSMQKKEAAAASADYLTNMSNATLLMLSGGADAEKCGNLINSVWSNSIYKKRDNTTDRFTRSHDAYGSFYDDFNTALDNLFSDSSFKSDIQAIRDNQSSVAVIMKSMTNPPDEWKEGYEALKEMYAAYLDLTELVISPSGNLTTFSSNFNNADSKLINAYNKLKIYLE